MKGRITKTGYRRNSPDVNNDFNIIPSNRISMKGVDFPVFGVDNMGNSQMMYPGGEYEYQGDYVTELPAYGSGGLTQWFAEKWVDIKTGKKCGRSGKDKKGRPYPACRPSKRVNSTTPKTKSEMSAAEKAKFKRKKTSGKRIDYNHKRAQQGIEVPRTIRYENSKMVLQDKPIYDGMLDEVTVTPYTASEYAFQENRANQATGGLQPVYPIFDALTLGLGAPSAIRKAPSVLNPKYFKPNSNMYYRGIGREGIKDALESGLFRAKPADKIPARTVDLGSLGKLDMAKRFNKTYYSPHFNIADRYGAGYIAEVPKDAANFVKRYKNTDWSMATKDQIPVSAGRILEKNWWSGYKPIKKYGGSLPKAQQGKYLPPAVRDMYPKEDPIYYDGMLAETTVTAPKYEGPQIRRALPGETDPINSNFSFIGVDKSGGLGALKAMGKGVKGLLGLRGATDDVVKGFNYTKGFGNPYEKLKITDDMFKGPVDYGVDYTGEIAKGRLDFVRNLGKELDDINFDAGWVGPEHLKFHGTPFGRSVVEVALPGKTHQTQLFYKSSGLAGKSGQGVKGTTQGLWQPYGGHATLLDARGPVHNWFIKDKGYETFYNSKSFKDVANRLDDLTKEAGFDLSGQAYKYQKGAEVVGRNGVRKNPDGSVSTHLMAREYVDGRGWVAFPTLFQNPDSSWVDMSQDSSWYPAYEEAVKRGEVYDFGEDVEAAINFSDKGSWKKQEGGQQGPPYMTEGPVSELIYPSEGEGPQDVLTENIKRTGKLGVTSKPAAPSVDADRLRKGIKYAESLGGKLMMNPESSATGFYGQLFSEIDGKDFLQGVTRQDFANDTTLQNKVFDERLAGNEGLFGKKTGLVQDGLDLYNEYKPQLGDKLKYTPTEIAALTNMLGRQGTREYLGYVLRDGKSLEEALPNLYGTSAKYKNKTPDQYISKFNEAFGDGGESIPVYNTYNTKNRAWLAARKNLGPGKKFMYGGKVYSTNTPKGL